MCGAEKGEGGADAGQEGGEDRQMTRGSNPEKEVQIMTWNVGGMPTERMAWHLVAGKRSSEWRGRMIAVCENLGKIVHKELSQDALGITVKTASSKLGVLNVHLPPKATLPETGQHMAVWENTQALKQPCRILLGDLNETFLAAQEDNEAWATLQHKTARGAMLLQWLSEHDMTAPNQDLATPTYHPYNHLHRPRRLDYIFWAGVTEGGHGKVHQLRHLASSDHDAVTAHMRVCAADSPSCREARAQRHGARQLKGTEQVLRAVAKHDVEGGQNARPAARGSGHYGESEKPLQVRGEQRNKAAKTPQARTLWKEEVWKKKKQHKEHWQWQKRMKTHFESIFKKQEGEEVRRRVHDAWRRLERRCKDHPWEPFTAEELMGTMARWKGGKSTGPDGVAFEALKAVCKEEHWQHAILQEFNAALYKGKLPPDAKKSVTILLPKEPFPQQWSATRPIALSNSCLKWQSQLLLARTTKSVFQGTPWQYAQPGKQPAELILSIRKAVRTCREWGLPLHLVKIDVAKAFDTVSQAQLAILVEQQVGVRGGRPWEARLWTDMLMNERICVSMANETHDVQQTNGVRQGAPDSPVIFAAMVGQILNEVLGPPSSTANLTPPTPMRDHREEAHRDVRPKGDRAPDGGPPMPANGGGFQDDVYLWSHDKEFLQAKLGMMVRSLRARNLQVNATKTKYVHNQEGKQVIRVGEVDVEGERDGTLTVLGAPVAMTREVTQILAEVTRRARGAFAVHKQMLTGGGSIDHKMLAYTRYVATSALWAIGAAHPHDSLLRGINSIQLMQLRQVLSIKRRALEPWAQWNQRSLRQARQHLEARPTHRWSTMALTYVWRLWGHTARNDRGTGLMLGWRNQAWWRAEQQKAHGLRHPGRFNAMLETEKLLEKIVAPWRATAQDRDKWKHLEQAFVKRYDPGTTWRPTNTCQLPRVATRQTPEESKRAHA